MFPFKKNNQNISRFERFLDRLSPPKMFAFSFLIIIIIGVFLLSLPVTHHDGIIKPKLIDIVFTSTSAVTVTGLQTLRISQTWNRLGQLIIMILVQLGGLSFIVLISFLILSFSKKISLYQRQGIQAAFGIENVEVVKGVVKTSVAGALLLEGLGFIFFSISLRLDGLSLGDSLFYGLTESISIFANAGFNLVGRGNLTHFRENKIILLFMILIAEISSLGFIVWLDILNNIKKYRKDFSKRQRILGKTPKNMHFFKNFSLHTKLVLITTVVIHIFAVIVFVISEYNNPILLGKSFPEKLFDGFLFSSSSRFSGEAYHDFSMLNEFTRSVSIILMMTGGGSGSVTGGIKTTTIAVLFCCVITVLKGQDDIKVLRRTIPRETVMKAITIFFVMVIVVFLTSSFLALSFRGSSFDFSLIDILFETTSALSNTGISVSITNHLSSLGKSLFIFLMYLGRLGPITLVVFLSNRKSRNMDMIKFPKENILVG